MDFFSSLEAWHEKWRSSYLRVEKAWKDLKATHKYDPGFEEKRQIYFNKIEEHRMVWEQGEMFLPK